MQIKTLSLLQTKICIFPLLFIYNFSANFRGFVGVISEFRAFEWKNAHFFYDRNIILCIWIQNTSKHYKSFDKGWFFMSFFIPSLYFTRKNIRIFDDASKSHWFIEFKFKTRFHQSIYIIKMAYIHKKNITNSNFGPITSLNDHPIFFSHLSKLNTHHPIIERSRFHHFNPAFSTYTHRRILQSQSGRLRRRRRPSSLAKSANFDNNNKNKSLLPLTTCATCTCRKFPPREISRQRKRYFRFAQIFAESSDCAIVCCEFVDVGSCQYGVSYDVFMASFLSHIASWRFFDFVLCI